jgi:hypothetical protein
VSEWKDLVGADILTLGMAADERRREVLKNNVVTYLRVHQVADVIAETPPAAAELRLHEAPPALDEAVARVRAMKAAAGPRRVVAFSWTDIAERGWSGVSALKTLVEAGLSDVAELPADQVSDLDGALEALMAAGIAPQRLTVSRPLGGERTELIERVRRIFAKHASLRRFSPLPRTVLADKPTTGYDDVRMVAIARLALPQQSIEVDWQLYGPKLAQVALTLGADHLDAVSALDDTTLGPRRGTVEDVERNIRAAGFEPRAVIPGY